MVQSETRVSECSYEMAVCSGENYFPDSIFQTVEWEVLSKVPALYELNKQNKGLQDTIVSLNQQIENLELDNENQDNKIKELEDKFNSVFDIAKEIKDKVSEEAK